MGYMTTKMLNPTARLHLDTAKLRYYHKNMEFYAVTAKNGRDKIPGGSFIYVAGNRI